MLIMGMIFLPNNLLQYKKKKKVTRTEFIFFTKQINFLKKKKDFCTPQKIQEKSNLEKILKTFHTTTTVRGLG